MSKPAALAVQPQLGQSHTATGALDLSAVYVIHHAIRRDMQDFNEIVPITSLTNTDRWAALERRWADLSTAVGHHCRVEDEHMWPAIRQALGEEDTSARAILEDMSSSHREVANLMRAAALGFSVMARTPGLDVRDRLVAAIRAARDAMCDHLTHEEQAALPLMQRHVSLSRWKAAMRAAGKEYGVADLRFAVPWSAHEIPPDQFAIAFAHGGPLMRILLAFTRRRFNRDHYAAFGS